MNFKIDENLPIEIAKLLTQAGHSTLTVYDQRISDSIDQKLISVCVREGRALVTLDLDFSYIQATHRTTFPVLLSCEQPINPNRC